MHVANLDRRPQVSDTNRQEQQVSMCLLSSSLAGRSPSLWFVRGRVASHGRVWPADDCRTPKAEERRKPPRRPTTSQQHSAIRTRTRRAHRRERGGEKEERRRRGGWAEHPREGVCCARCARWSAGADPIARPADRQPFQLFLSPPTNRHRHRSNGTQGCLPHPPILLVGSIHPRRRGVSSVHSSPLASPLQQWQQRLHCDLLVDILLASPACRRLRSSSSPPFCWRSAV